MIFEPGQRVIVTTTKDVSLFQAEFVHVAGTVIDSTPDTVTYRHIEDGEIETVPVSSVHYWHRPCAQCGKESSEEGLNAQNLCFQCVYG